LDKAVDGVSVFGEVLVKFNLDKFFLISAGNAQREAFVVPVSPGFQVDARDDKAAIRTA
jgi:hypothetical protein